MNVFKALASIVGTNCKNFRQSVSMAAIELNKAYSGSSFGVVWAFVKPVLFVLVYWFGITIGIKGGNDGNVPYIYKLIASILPWFFMFICGYYLGTYAKKNKFPQFFYNQHIRPLSVVGKYTLWIYIFHQPVIYGLFYALSFIMSHI